METWRRMTDADRHFDVPRCDCWISLGCQKWAEFILKDDDGVTIGERCEDHVPTAPVEV